MQSLVLFSLAMTATALKMPVAINALAPRVVLSPLPIVYVYDHCPFCVRVRLALGLKNVKHNVYFLANDDVPTPTALIGKKIAPIFSETGSPPMPESLDIIAKVDADSKYGKVGLFKPMSGRKDINDWQKKVADTNRILQRPRYMMTALPEFQQQDAKNAFVKNHPVPPFEKDPWKALPKEEQWGHYCAAYVQSLGKIDELNASLIELDKLVYSTEYCTEGGLSMDDIDLWSRLRSISIVKGVKWPEKLGKYMKHFEVLGDVPLYDSMAC